VSPLKMAISGVGLVVVLVASSLAVTGAVPLQTNVVPSISDATRPVPGSPPPLVIHKVKPSYPPDMLASADIAAAIMVTVTVSPEGNVTRVDEPKWRLTIGSDSHIGDEAAFWASKPWLPFAHQAEAAVRQWRFAKSATESRADIEFVFSTRKDVAAAEARVAKTNAGTGKPAIAATSARPGEATTPAATQGPFRVGGAIKAPRKLFDVKPVYPEDAAAAGVQGVVILDVTIAKDGSVADATIRRSIPLLDQAALDAVRQWRFTPTVLDGEPIDVLMTVTVNFTLSH
jgi:TonB family protein